MPGDLIQSASRRARKRKATAPSRLPGLAWVPVPLAMLAAALGWLVLGGTVGQHAAAAADQRAQGYQAGGLALNVDAMLWLSNDMSGQGPVKNPNPHGFKMAPAMMPGMQPVGENRLRVEFSIANVTSVNQRYTQGDFRVVTAAGHTYPADAPNGSTQPMAAILRPGFGTTIDLYFDVPTAQSKNLSIAWSRDGTTVTFPVNTNGKLPSPHVH